jgi:glutamate-1-semialdehyde aminotransferase/acyl carrier protein
VFPAAGASDIDGGKGTARHTRSCCSRQPTERDAVSESRFPRLLAEIQDELEQLSGLSFAGTPPETSFFDHGLDSLLLTQAATALGKRFGVVLKLRDLVETHPSCAALASHLDAQLPAGAFASRAAGNAPASTGGPPDAARPLPSMPTTPAELLANAPQDVRELVRAQLELMARQLQLLGGAAIANGVPAAAPSATVPAPAATATQPAAPAAAEPAAQAASAAPAAGAAPARHGPQLVIDKTSTELSPTQERHLKKLVARYTARTAASKGFTAANRAHIADPRTVAGFTPQLKELVYPIVVRSSSGCRLTDLDGNEYVDLLSGYGSNFFGFGAPFVREAVAAQMAEGMEIGPQSHLVAEVATLFRKLVPCDRLAFCNTGSEAVLAAVRMARTATGRDLVVVFTGGYHGIFDEVVARPTPKRTMPAAPGIPRAATDNILVLPWNDPAALEVVRARIAEIAAVVAEPVQSRAPHVQPIEFLRELRRITADGGAALVFDEVVTGFRVAPGGAQQLFGIDADIATYGKVVGAGVPIGVVAGRARFLDALDGGPWQYGDASVPEVGVTYFAGTFVRHPIALAAARAALRFMIDAGPDLQRSVSQRTDRLASALNALFADQNAPMRVRHFASIMKVELTQPIKLAEIVFHHLRERGVHVWDGRPSFLTMAHTDADLAHVVAAFQGAVHDMQAGEFFPAPLRAARADAPPVPGARLGRDERGNPAWFVADASTASGFRVVGGPVGGA